MVLRAMEYGRSAMNEFAHGPAGYSIVFMYPQETPAASLRGKFVFDWMRTLRSDFPEVQLPEIVMPDDANAEGLIGLPTCHALFFIPIYEAVKNVEQWRRLTAKPTTSLIVDVTAPFWDPSRVEPPEVANWLRIPRNAEAFRECLEHAQALTVSAPYLAEEACDLNPQTFLLEDLQGEDERSTMAFMIQWTTMVKAVIASWSAPIYLPAHQES